MKRYTVKINGSFVVMVGGAVTLSDQVSNFSLWQPTAFDDPAQALRLVAAQWKSVGVVTPLRIVIDARV
jgi:hypothetical protein